MVQYSGPVDLAFAALGDPTRRAVLERLGAGSATISELAEPFGMSLTGMKKHVRLLEEAELVTTEKVGRVRRWHQHVATAAGQVRPGSRTHERSPMSPTKKKEGFSAEEKAAMRARAKELKVAAEGEEAIQAAFKKMTPDDRALGERVHAIVKDTAPDLTPKTWYGMPAYADKNGKVVVFYRDAAKFKERYAMLGFQDNANLDDGSMWPVAFALTTKLTKADESKIKALVKQAVS
jgi:DNA-binding transcriptional ArsR family regulator